jgi:hypothetical protein
MHNNVTSGATDPIDPDAVDEVVQRAVARLRERVHVDPAFDARVMEAVRSEGQVSTAHRFSMNRSIQLWSVGAIFMAAMVFLVVYRISGSSRVLPQAQSATSIDRRTPAAPGVHTVVVAAGQTPATTRIVRFTLAVPPSHAIRRVTIAGSFNGWDASVTPLHPVGRAMWTADVPLTPGRYVYQFVINGRHWVPDPTAPRDASADFGSSNSVVTVTVGGVI